MTNIGRVIGISFLLFVAMSTTAAAQWGFGPVVVFDERDGRGNPSSFGVGEYLSNRNQFGTLRNDSARSVTVPNGYRVRFCEDEGYGQGSGKCEDVGEGNHNLKYGATASYIRVTGPANTGWNGGWNGGGQIGATLYEDPGYRGRSQDYGVGRYLAIGGQLGNVRNDRASSLVVNRGFRVRLCESEGNNGRGSGQCEDYTEGRYNLRFNDMASFVEVQRSGWNGGWNGGGWNGGNDGDGGYGQGGGGGQSNNTNVVVFTDRNQRGKAQQFSVGIYRADARQFGALANDSASSVSVPPNHRVRLCENEGTLGLKGRCEEYGPGTYDLRYDNTASLIEVRRGNDRWDDDDRGNGGGWNGGGGNDGGGRGVIVFTDLMQRGISQEFREGTYRFIDNQFGRLPNDAASSIIVPPGFRVRLCENEGRGPKGERCEEMGPGSYNLAHNDKASSIFVTRN